MIRETGRENWMGKINDAKNECNTAAAAKRPIFSQNPRLKPTELCYLMRAEPNAEEWKNERHTKRDYTLTTLWQLQLNKLVDRKILYDLMMNTCLSCKKWESHLTVNWNLLWYEHMCTFRNYIGISRWRRNANEYTVHHNKNRFQVCAWWVSAFFPFRSDFAWTIYTLRAHTHTYVCVSCECTIYTYIILNRTNKSLDNFSTPIMMILNRNSKHIQQMTCSITKNCYFFFQSLSSMYFPRMYTKMSK